MSEFLDSVIPSQQAEIPAHRQMTVKELIVALLNQPMDALVWNEGCDCHGAAAGVEYQKDNTVLITRL